MRYVLAIALLCGCTRQNATLADAATRDFAVVHAPEGDMASEQSRDLAEPDPIDMATPAPDDMSSAPDLAEPPDQAQPIDMATPADLAPSCPILPACASTQPLCCNGASCINGYCWNATGGPCDDAKGPLCFGTGSYCGTDHKCH